MKESLHLLEIGGPKLRSQIFRQRLIERTEAHVNTTQSSIFYAENATSNLQLKLHLIFKEVSLVTKTDIEVTQRVAHAGDGDDEMFLFGSQWAAADLVMPEPSRMPGPAAGTAQALSNPTAAAFAFP